MRRGEGVGEGGEVGGEAARDQQVQQERHGRHHLHPREGRHEHCLTTESTTTQQSQQPATGVNIHTQVPSVRIGIKQPTLDYQTINYWC